MTRPSSHTQPLPAQSPGTEPESNPNNLPVEPDLGPVPPLAQPDEPGPAKPVI
ncbi:MAG TPA: hypothetical protein VE934_17680 [Polaromonas sp.]|uniref:hypothetical protein n=1 Tax=Polaromonas sp. TaxID=1869339 RepID=UPI002D429387|nr:hypothetical protein [Polaromonas sp.]HYW58785.1 hypothetical protein [Polaromonas sp.]